MAGKPYISKPRLWFSYLRTWRPSLCMGRRMLCPACTFKRQSKPYEPAASSC